MVAIVSVGAPRELLLRPRGGGESVRHALGHGDLLVMGGSLPAHVGARGAQAVPTGRAPHQHPVPAPRGALIVQRSRSRSLDADIEGVQRLQRGKPWLPLQRRRSRVQHPPGCRSRTTTACSVKEILPRLTALNATQLKAVTAYEKAGKNRVTLLHGGPQGRAGPRGRGPGAGRGQGGPVGGGEPTSPSRWTSQGPPARRDRSTPTSPTPAIEASRSTIIVPEPRTRRLRPRLRYSTSSPVVVDCPQPQVPSAPRPPPRPSEVPPARR